MVANYVEVAHDQTHTVREGIKLVNQLFFTNLPKIGTKKEIYITMEDVDAIMLMGDAIFASKKISHVKKFLHRVKSHMWLIIR